MKPADLVIVSLVGKRHERNPIVYANPEARYDWDWQTGLSMCCEYSFTTGAGLVAWAKKNPVRQACAFLAASVRMLSRSAIVASRTNNQKGWMMRFAELALPFAALLFIAAGEPSGAAEPPATTLKEPGAMLQEGNCGYGDAGPLTMPSAFEGLALSAWPTDGWTRLMIEDKHIDVVAAPVEKGRPPVFMHSILKQLEDSQSPVSVEAAPFELTADQARAIYLRVPGVSLHEGSVPLYLFKNGTARLSPQFDYRYELMLGTQPFAFSVQNGLRSKNGAPYGDGKPDFIIDAEGDNSGARYILLSSKAKPGKNPPTASLSSGGC